MKGQPHASRTPGGPGAGSDAPSAAATHQSRGPRARQTCFWALFQRSRPKSEPLVARASSAGRSPLYWYWYCCSAAPPAVAAVFKVSSSGLQRLATVYLRRRRRAWMPLTRPCACPRPAT